MMLIMNERENAMLQSPAYRSETLRRFLPSPFFCPLPRGGHSGSNRGYADTSTGGTYGASPAQLGPAAKPEPLRFTGTGAGLPPYGPRPIAEPAPKAIPYGTCSGFGMGSSADIIGRCGRVWCAGGGRGGWRFVHAGWWAMWCDAKAGGGFACLCLGWRGGGEIAASSWPESTMCWMCMRWLRV